MELLAGHMCIPETVTTFSFDLSVPVPPPPIYVLSVEIPKSLHFVLSNFFSLAFGGFIKQG